MLCAHQDLGGYLATFLADAADLTKGADWLTMVDYSLFVGLGLTWTLGQVESQDVFVLSGSHLEVFLCGCLHLERTLEFVLPESILGT
jgi:hypothetical protein